MEGVRSRRSALTRASIGWLAIVVFARVVVVPAERCPPVDPASIRAGAQAAIDWLVDNQNADGRWLYRYDRASDRSIDDYNIVRHAGVLWSLEQAATAGFDEASPSADAGFAWAATQLTEHDDWVAFGRDASIKVGASALLAIALIERRDRTGARDRDQLIEGLGRFLLSQVESSGAVLAYWDRESAAPVEEAYSPFFTGETWWALIRLHQTFGDPQIGAAVDSVGRYLATERDRAESYWPGVPDHWAAYGLAQINDRRELTADEQLFADRLGGRFGIQVRYESQRTDSLVSWATRGRRTLGAGLGTIGEALSALWRVALADQIDDRPRSRDGGDPDRLAERTRCVAGMLLDRQATAEDARDDSEPGRVVGAWFQFEVTQMDDQQHGLSALLLTLSLVEEEMGR